MTREEAYAYCRRLTIAADSNFALGFRFLPTPKKNAIYAVYAFNRLADDFADEPDFKDDPLQNLERWEQMLGDCYEGRVSKHPVITAFSDTIRRFNIPKKPFKDAIDGFKMDLTTNRYKTFDDLKIYCDRVAGTISSMSLHIFGWINEKAFEYGNYLSYALQLTNIIRDVGTDIKKNRIYIPLEDLEKTGYSENELFSRTYNEKFRKLMQSQIERARDYFKKAEPLIQLVHKDSRYTVVMIGAVYAQLLQKIVDRNIPVLSEVVTLNKWEKMKVAVKMKFNPTFIIPLK